MMVKKINLTEWLPPDVSAPSVKKGALQHVFDKTRRKGKRMLAKAGGAGISSVCLRRASFLPT